MHRGAAGLEHVDGAAPGGPAAGGLADLLRMKRLPEAWIAPPAVRELRELVRHRAKLVAVRSGLRAQIHAVLAKEGIAVPMSDLFGTAGMCLLGDAPLARAYRLRVSSLLDLIDAFDHEVEVFRRMIAEQLDGHLGYRAIQDPRCRAGVRRDLRRRDRRRHSFARPPQLCSWAGLTPKHHESDTTVRRGHITKQGSRLVRWAAVEAVQKLPVDVKLRTDRDRIAGRRGKAIGKVAAARKLLTLVFYGLRDGHIRCLARKAAA